MRRAARQQLVGCAAAALALFALEVGAAVPVEESTGTTVRGQARPATTAPSTTTSSSTARTYPAGGTSTSTPAPPSGGGSAELFYQIQLLQTEVSELRGLVEEQAHQISRLEASQKEQYMDVDRRLAALAGVSSNSDRAAPPPMEGTVTNAGPTTGGSRPTGDEQADYTAAYKLVAANKPADAIDALTRFLRDYPDGKFAGNAYYWLGEAYLALPDADLERARQAFVQVQTRFPTHAKVPDAIFKLGVVYHMLGDTPKAIEYFGKVQSDFPGSAAAQLAKSYAAELH